MVGVANIAMSIGIAIAVYHLAIAIPVQTRVLLPGAFIIAIGTYVVTLVGGLYVKRRRDADVRAVRTLRVDDRSPRLRQRDRAGVRDRHRGQRGQRQATLAAIDDRRRCTRPTTGRSISRCRARRWHLLIC